MNLRFLSATAVALALAGSPALAQDHHHDKHGEHRGSVQHVVPSHAEHRSAPSHAFQHANPPSFRHAARMHGDHHEMVTTTASPAEAFHNRNAHAGERQFHGDQIDHNRHSYDQQHHHGYDRYGVENRNHEQRGYEHRGYEQYRYDHHQSYRQNWNGRGHIEFHRHNAYARQHYHYRGGHWYWPRGYHYHRWSFGMTLPSIFWGRDYWIDDFYDYGLAPPPPGCVWVRYGPDALLIDRYTGEILEVVYGQFY